MLQRRVLFIAPAQAVTRIFPELRDAGFDVGIAENLKGASSFIRKTPPAAIFSRPSLPGYKVEDLLSVGQDDQTFPQVIVFTDKGNAEEAKHYLEAGAKDYWLEPLSPEKIMALLPQRKEATPTPAFSTLGGHTPQYSDLKIIGNNQSLQRVLALARQVAKSKATVLISGESGTGKEMFSRFLHAHSDRAAGPFIALNCAALPEHLLESELFGHEKGAFTGAIVRKLGKFEMAHGGTILLDEISEMELSLQTKLLRALQEGQIDRVGGSEPINVDVRVLATTNRNLEDWVKQGKFRQDLYFRLNVIPLRLPSLKERGEDVLILADFFIRLYVNEYHLPSTVLSEEAKKWLMEYAWPGNVRELQNLMERSVLLCNGSPITPVHFLLDPDNWPIFADDAASGSHEGGSGPDLGGSGKGAAFSNDSVGTTGTLPDATADAGTDSVNGANRTFAGAVIPLHEMERLMIIRGLDQTGGNRTQAADLLGISVRTLRNKLNEYREQGINLGLVQPES
ncbi:MAG: sigma-54 dependent transcriptional regulator [Deltaproteobacteria bacterium]|jgi:DNA-binding NtrC family response regulator|nr:sigma-54 dependent transcriptional regulator [Deltaproteobacteria bacterium]